MQKKLDYVKWIEKNKITIHCESKEFKNLLNQLGAKRKLFNRKIWIAYFTSEQELAIKLQLLKDEDFMFMHAPMEIFILMKNKQLVSGEPAELIRDAPEEWELSEYQMKSNHNFEELIILINQILDLLRLPGTDVVWSHWNTEQEAIDYFTQILEKLKNNDDSVIKELKLIFAPTGSLQEVAISSGWSRAYIYLSTQFDLLTEPTT